MSIIDDLIRDEGLKLKPYLCTAGKLTIGVGRNLDDVGITREEAIDLLGNDIDRVEAECQKQPWWPAVANDGVRSRAMLNMAFNVGLSRLSGFKRMLAAVQVKDWTRASKEMLDSKWASQVGQRAVRLAKMMETGCRDGQ